MNTWAAAGAACILISLGIWQFQHQNKPAQPILTPIGHSSEFASPGSPPSTPLVLIEDPTSPTGNSSIKDFNKAKKIAAKLYKEHPFTFYCNCTFEQKLVHLNTCDYTPGPDLARAVRVEWEHIVPAHDFGRSFPEWREGHKLCVHKKTGKPFKGRRCAQLASKTFRYMEADLYNLVPEVGEINARRGDLPMTLLESTENLTPTCKTKISKEGIEPRPEIRGFIARTYFYMDYSYPHRGIVSQKNQKLFSVWHKKYPPDAWEIKRAHWIQRTQKNPHPFIAKTTP